MERKGENLCLYFVSMFPIKLVDFAARMCQDGFDIPAKPIPQGDAQIGGFFIAR
jgi:hypothetical protein